GILSIICILSFFGNISLWIVIIKTKDLHKESNYLTLCLSFADILVSMGMPITCLTIVYGEWIFDDVICQVLGFVNMVTFIGSVTSLGVISMNRYIKICKPYKYSVVYTKRNIFLMIAGVWILSSALATPPLFGWGVYAYLPNQSFCFCDWATSVSYTFFMVGTCFGGPCTVMTVCYVLILRKLRASSRKSVQFRAKEIRITALFLIVIFAFVISWFPFCIAMFMSVFCKEYLSRHFDMFTLLLGYANSCYNPFIYGVLNLRVKQGYKTVFGKCIPKSI
ncbi:hypothetical protein LOTGIDRAFT_73938, partial [Lottia gigantea]